MTADRSEWFKSSYSHQNGECVEARRAGTGMSLRDTKDRERGTLAFGSDAWGAFLGGVIQGAFRAV
ncbi:DUF397 domain-containing protein [Streptomyces sp. NPDC050617]|uniref:DUF397 domain-containing protein n=1 Tax=Streptomyces sp. NPDC050617 TaxID=3154628 RepID=UPI0034457D7C